jgi:hypothetical protein
VAAAAVALDDVERGALAAERLRAATPAGAEPEPAVRAALARLEAKGWGKEGLWDEVHAAAEARRKAEAERTGLEAAVRAVLADVPNRFANIRGDAVLAVKGFPTTYRSTVEMPFGYSFSIKRDTRGGMSAFMSTPARGAEGRAALTALFRNSMGPGCTVRTVDDRDELRAPGLPGFVVEVSDLGMVNMEWRP